MLRQMIVLSAALLSSGAMAQKQGSYYKSGNDLLVECSGTNVDQNICTSYILGVLDTSRALGVGDDLTKPVLPAGVTGGQLKDVVTRYLNMAPEMRHYPAAQLVYIAVMVAFPAPKLAAPKG